MKSIVKNANFRKGLIMKLRTVRYFGSFYEYNGGLGWMPFWRVWIIKLFSNVQVNWVPQSKVRFN